MIVVGAVERRLDPGIEIARLCDHARGEQEEWTVRNAGWCGRGVAMNSRAVKVKTAHSFGVRCEKSGARLSLAAFFRCQRRPCHFIVVARSLR